MSNVNHPSLHETTNVAGDQGGDLEETSYEPKHMRNDDELNDASPREKAARIVSERLHSIVAGTQP